MRLSYTAWAMADATDCGLEPADTLRNGSSLAGTTFSVSLNLCTFVVVLCAVLNNYGDRKPILNLGNLQ